MFLSFVFYPVFSFCVISIGIIMSNKNCKGILGTHNYIAFWKDCYMLGKNGT